MHFGLRYKLSSQELDSLCETTTGMKIRNLKASFEIPGTYFQGRNTNDR